LTQKIKPYPLLLAEEHTISNMEKSRREKLRTRRDRRTHFPYPVPSSFTPSRELIYFILALIVSLASIINIVMLNNPFKARHLRALESTGTKSYWNSDECQAKQVENPSVTIDVNYRCNSANAQELYPKIDIVSIGSNKRIDYVSTQMTTWARHPSVRTFWGLTELDDTDKDCEANLGDYISECKIEKETDSDMMGVYRLWHYDEADLKKRGIPHAPSWICSQKRPGHGLAKIGSAYKKLIQYVGAHEALPDYLFLVDDDTYFNMDLFTKFVKGKNNTVPIVYAGCAMQFHPRNLMWTFPWGGYGVVFSRGSIENLIHPLDCKNNLSHSKMKDFELLACARIQDNLLGERDLFRDGMSISDLASAISSKKDFCMHSDWLTGHLVNYYFLSEPVEVEYHRIHEYFWRDNCAFEVGVAGDDGKRLRCTRKSHVCHKRSSQEMKNIKTE